MENQNEISDHTPNLDGDGLHLLGRLKRIDQDQAHFLMIGALIKNVDE
jgi:hypothetical protein